MSLPLAPPAGMRDLCPPESVERRALARNVGRRFEAHGYQLIATPWFEHAEVLERGLEALDRRDLLRFVEPESGEVALLRPDITPQVARVIATRLHDRPPPYRLYYEGTVFRRRHGRARRHRQIAQTGIECVGLEGPAGDAEVLAIAIDMAESLGLKFNIELKHPRVVRNALQQVPDALRESVETALLSKDRATLERLLHETTTEKAPRDRILALPELYGDLDVLEEAERILGDGDGDGDAIRELRLVATTLSERGVSAPLTVDLGELRGHAYYTGVGFDLLAAGPGEPIGRGGRYDDLLQGFGTPRPATGFALDLDNLAWALEAGHLHIDDDHAPGVVAQNLSPAAIGTLRNVGLRVAEAPMGDFDRVRSYASAWGFRGVVQPGTEPSCFALSELGKPSVVSFATAMELAKHLTRSMTSKPIGSSSSRRA